MGSKNIIKIIVLLIFFLSIILFYFLIQNNNNKKQFDLKESQTKFQNASKSSNLHYSFFNQEEFYDKAFKKLKVIENNENNIKGIVVNHHLLAPELIAEALNVVSSSEPRTVVLISPNHFFSGRGQIISSLYNWQTPYGILEADKKLIAKMQDKKLLNIEEWPFEKEHGVSNLVAFIKKTLPNAKIVPLIVKDTYSPQKRKFFAEKLAEILPHDSLVIASLDFSHNLPSSAADFHDQKNLAVLNNLDYQGIEFLDIDSKPTLGIFLQYLDLKNATSFNLLGHSNSAKILKDDNILETTSYITGFFSSGSQVEDKKVTILAFGNLILDGSVKQAIEEDGDDYPFVKIKRFLGGNDFVLTNLEGSFSDFHAKPIYSDRAIFSFNSDLVPVLKRFGFNIFNLANNHSLDLGETGIMKSKNYLKNSGLNYFGDSLNNINISIVKESRKTKIGFVGFNELSGVNMEKVISEIESIKDSVDFIVVYAHWGNEHRESFSEKQQKNAYQLIDAGADVILGSHPHAIQPIEIYKDKIIFYSLGDFLFDRKYLLKEQQGIGVGIVFDDSDVEYYLFPIETKDSQIYLTGKEKTNSVLDKLAKSSSISQDIKNQILQGKIKINSQNLLLNKK